VIGAKAEQRIDLNAPDRLRALAGEGLDVHAAFGGHHREVSPGAPIEDDRRVELLRDRQQLLGQDAVHRVALEPIADHALGRVRGSLR